MNNESQNKPLKPKPKSSLSQEVGARAARKLRAQRHVTRTVWFGLGMMGLVGWSVAIPTLLGAALGLWLDKRHSGTHSWTLMLIVIGLIIGCVNAWHWVTREDKVMRDEQKDDDE